MLDEKMRFVPRKLLLRCSTSSIHGGVPPVIHMDVGTRQSDVGTSQAIHAVVSTSYAKHFCIYINEFILNTEHRFFSTGITPIRRKLLQGK